MRVLFTTWNWVSHLDPMIPLAGALADDGHEVLLAGQPGLAPAAARAGIAFRAVGSDLDVAGRFREFVLPPSATAPVRRPAGPPSGPRALRVFADLATDMTPGLCALVRDLQPDLLVTDPTCWAGAIAAAEVRVPLLRLGFGVDLLAPLRDHVRNAVDGVARELGYAPVDPYAAPLLDTCPPDLQVPVTAPRIPMRYRPRHTGHTGPSAVPAGAGARRVCLTWGTTMSRLGPEYFALPDALRALDDLPGVQLVAAVTAAQRPAVEAAAARMRRPVTVLTSPPLERVLARCDLMVAHGGAGSMLTAAVAGVPQVLVPQLPDHAGHAARLAATGAGTVRPRSSIEDGSLRAAVTAVLTGSSDSRDAAADARAGGATVAARALAARMADLPTPAAVARRLPDLLATSHMPHQEEDPSCSLNCSWVPAGA